MKPAILAVCPIEIADVVLGSIGGVALARARVVPPMATAVAAARIEVKIEDLASTITAERRMAEAWLADRHDEPGGIEWCAYVLDVDADALALGMRLRAVGLREKRRAHRAHLREVRSQAAELPL